MCFHEEKVVLFIRETYFVKTHLNFVLQTISESNVHDVFYNWSYVTNTKILKKNLPIRFRENTLRKL